MGVNSCALLRASVVANDPSDRAIIDRRVPLVGADEEIPAVVAFLDVQLCGPSLHTEQLLVLRA